LFASGAPLEENAKNLKKSIYSTAIILRPHSLNKAKTRLQKPLFYKDNKRLFLEKMWNLPFLAIISTPTYLFMCHFHDLLKRPLNALNRYTLAVFA
jgi:hypothetical protein